MLTLSFETFFKQACGEFLLEDTEVLIHLTHLEELILTSKEDGLNTAINFLNSLFNTFKGNADSSTYVTVKFDGSPSLICGYLPETGKFFVSTKSFGNKERKINTSNEEIIRNHGHSPGLVKKLQIGLEYLPQVIKPGGIYQGDFLFDTDDLVPMNIEGEKLITFKPNTITYAVEKDSALGHKIQKAKMGIIFHTKYEGSSLDNLKKSADVNVTDFNLTSDVFVDDAKFKDIAGTATFTRSESIVLEKLIQKSKQVGSTVDWSSLSDSVYEFLNTFINSLIRSGRFVQDPVDEYTNFVNWLTGKAQKSIEKMKTEKGRQAKQASFESFLEKIENNSMTVIKLLRLTKILEEAKQQFIKKYNAAIKTKQFITLPDGSLKVTSPEGYVAVDHIGRMVKFVDRLEFSQANFSVSRNIKSNEDV